MTNEPKPVSASQPAATPVSGGTSTPPATPAKAGPAAATPASVATGPKPVVSFDDFAKLDLRVARIVKAENHPSADRLLKLQLDDGSGQPRQICAGIKGHYTPEALVGREIIIVANLAPRMIRGEESRGMLLAASDMPKDAAAGATDANRRVVILQPEVEIVPGAIVS